MQLISPVDSHFLSFSHAFSPAKRERKWRGKELVTGFTGSKIVISGECNRPTQNPKIPSLFTKITDMTLIFQLWARLLLTQVNTVS